MSPATNAILAPTYFELTPHPPSIHLMSHPKTPRPTHVPREEMVAQPISCVSLSVCVCVREHTISHMSSTAPSMYLHEERCLPRVGQAHQHDPLSAPVLDIEVIVRVHAEDGQADDQHGDQRPWHVVPIERRSPGAHVAGFELVFFSRSVPLLRLLPNSQVVPVHVFGAWKCWRRS